VRLLAMETIQIDRVLLPILADCLHAVREGNLPASQVTVLHAQVEAIVRELGQLPSIDLDGNRSRRLSRLHALQEQLRAKRQALKRQQLLLASLPTDELVARPDLT